MRFMPGLCILLGGILGLFFVIIFLIFTLLQWRKTSVTSIHNDACTPELAHYTSGKIAFPKITAKEIQIAINNLLESNLIGEGTAGKVYIGGLSDNQRVAIKKITNELCADTFLREVRNILHVRHPNLVTLMGYSQTENECFLIYELCPNGNLSEWLHGKDKFLPWIQRVEIAIGCARGLRFLHTFPEGCIVHRDIKPTNILLGANFEAKLSDFGLSKVMKVGECCVSSEVRGTFGYVDPEYQRNGKVSAANDIYSFGVVLLQILSGRKVIDMNMRKPTPLNKTAKYVMKKGSLVEFADPDLNGEYSLEAFRVVFELALLCTWNGKQRPSIEQVVEKLEETLGISTGMNSFMGRTTPDWSEIP